MASDISPYQDTYNWAVPRLADYYRIDISTGEATLIRSEVAMGGDLSPSGQYFTYFNEDQGQHYLIDIEGNTGTCISCSRVDVDWTSDNNGMPFAPYPYGTIGYEREEGKIYIQSKYDIWAFEIATRNLTSITDEKGEKAKKRMTLNVWERDSVYVEPANSYIRAFNEKKRKGILYTNGHRKKGKDYTRMLYRTDHAINTLHPSKNGQQMLLRKSNLQDYADVYLTDKKLKEKNKD